MISVDEKSNDNLSLGVKSIEIFGARGVWVTTVHLRMRIDWTSQLSVETLGPEKSFVQ